VQKEALSAPGALGARGYRKAPPGLMPLLPSNLRKGSLWKANSVPLVMVKSALHTFQRKRSAPF
jgi:hypothetical protein